MKYRLAGFGPKILIGSIFTGTLLAGCGQSDQTRYWTLEPVPPSQALPARPIAPFQVAAVHIPAALDRQEVVQQVAPTRVELRDLDHWAGGFGDLLRQALTQDLMARLPQGSVIFPDAPVTPQTRALVVDVLALRPVGGAYGLDATWTLLVDGKPVPGGGVPLHLETPLGGADVASQATATSQLVGALADRIAQDLAQSDK